MLDVPGREVGWLNVTYYASIESYELDWKWLNGEIDKGEAPGHDDVLDITSLELSLQRNKGWT